MHSIFHGLIADGYVKALGYDLYHLKVTVVIDNSS